MSDANGPEREAGPARGKPDTRRLPLLVVAAAILGGLAGTVLGVASGARYEAAQSVRLDHVLAIDAGATNPLTATLADTVRRSRVHERAAADAGLDTSAFSSTGAKRVRDAPVVDVTLTNPDRKVAEQAIDALIRAAVADMLATERAAEQAAHDQDAPVLAALDAELRDAYTAAEAAPDTDLGDFYNAAVDDLEEAEAELAITDDPERRDRLEATRATAQARVDRVAPVLEQWDSAASARVDVTERLRRTDDRLRSLERGVQLLASEGFLEPPTVRKISPLATTGRFAAGGAGLGILAALGLAALWTRRMSTHGTDSHG